MKDNIYSSKLWEHRNCDVEITHYKNSADGRSVNLICKSCNKIIIDGEILDIMEGHIRDSQSIWNRATNVMLDNLKEEE